MKIAMMVTPHQSQRIEVAQKVCDYLRSKGAEILVNASAYPEMTDCGTSCENVYSMLKECDILVAVGGDGTIIHAAKQAAAYQKPVVGINSGRLGYLAAIENGELELMDRLFTGDYSIEHRMMLSAWTIKNPDRKYNALNDIVIAGRSIAKIVEIAVRCNGRSVLKYCGDGVIFATPTGSTAYAYSAGGPVVDPEIECISVTPVCPHSVASRTIIFSAVDRFNAEAKSANGGVYMAIDGEEGIPLDPANHVIIEKSQQQALLIKMKDEKFIDVLSKKIRNSEGR